MTGRATRQRSDSAGPPPTDGTGREVDGTDPDRERAPEPPPDGDSETASSLAGLEVLVVATFAGGGIHQYAEELVERLDGTISVETHDMASPPIGSGWRRFIRGLAMALVAMVRFPMRDRPDVVHLHTSHRFSFYRAAPYALFVRYVWRRPVILHVHGSAFDEFVHTDSLAVAALQRAVFAVCQEIVVLSSYWAETVSLRADPDRIRVLPNAVDPDTFPTGNAVDPETVPTGDGVDQDTSPSERGRADATGPREETGDVEASSASPADDGEGESIVPHVVFVSNLIERKGVPELVAALERLCEKHPGEFRVSIAGDGPLRAAVERLADECAEVRALGYVSEERKRSLLADADVYVLPTHAEGLPIAMLEGMAGRNAVVATSVGSIPEVVDDDRGILVEPGDVDGLVDALETLIRSPERREELAANNREAVETEYSWDAIIDELLGLYARHAESEAGAPKREPARSP